MLHMYGLKPATAHQPGDMLAKAACLSAHASYPVLHQHKDPRPSPQQQTALGWPVCRACCRLSSRVTRRALAALERWTGCQKPGDPSWTAYMLHAIGACVFLHVLSRERNNSAASPCAVAAVICRSLWQWAAGRALACPFSTLICSIQAYLLSNCLQPCHDCCCSPRPTLSPEDLDEDASWAAAAVRSELNETPIDNIKELDLLQLSMAISSYVASSESPPHLVLEQVGGLLRAWMVPARLEWVFWCWSEDL